LLSRGTAACESNIVVLEGRSASEDIENPSSIEKLTYIELNQCLTPTSVEESWAGVYGIINAHKWKEVSVHLHSTRY
jgi:hypothetical protein